ncbi:MAG: hypothetical protein JWM27_1642 [Gemmatimonadetes bacterium]|nr:hypothetical protein [Gemmatimonadota bacterium]
MSGHVVPSRHHPMKHLSWIFGLVLLSACEAPTAAARGRYDIALTSSATPCDYCGVGDTTSLVVTAYEDEPPFWQLHPAPRYRQYVADARVRLVVRDGGVVLSDTLVRTGADGTALVKVTFSRPGRAELAAVRPGQDPSTSGAAVLWDVFPAPLALRFSADSVALASPGCPLTVPGLLNATVAGMPVTAHPLPVRLESLDPPVTSRIGWTQSTGSVELTTSRPGRSRITATVGNATDTPLVIAPPVRVTEVRLYLIPFPNGVGDSTTVVSSLVADCGAIVPGGRPALENGTPGILVIDTASVFDASGNATSRGTVRAAGTLRVVARSGDLSATVTQLVRHYAFLPADTTIGPGGSFTYRPLVDDGPGTPTERWDAPGPFNQYYRVRFSSSDTTVAAVGEYTGVATGRAPGVATITAQRLDHHGDPTYPLRTGTLHVKS